MKSVQKEGDKCGVLGVEHADNKDSIGGDAWNARGLLEDTELDGDESSKYCFMLMESIVFMIIFVF